MSPEGRFDLCGPADLERYDTHDYCLRHEAMVPLDGPCPATAALLAAEREAGAAEVRARVEAVCARHEHGALRWADPLPVPEWIAELRAALNGGE